MTRWDRFWGYVQPTGFCWEWNGQMDNGRARYAGRGAHTIAYEALVGPVPDGLTLDHLCRMPACVNPDHLEPVTASENTKRAWSARGGRKTW